MQNAAYPITLTSPNTQSSYGVVATAVAAAATAAIPKPAALCLRWSVWRTRPGHVLCVEQLEMQTAPLLLEVEQVHAMQLMQFGKSLLAPFADASHAVRYVMASNCVSTNRFCMTAAIITQLLHDCNKLFVSTGNYFATSMLCRRSTSTNLISAQWMTTCQRAHAQASLVACNLGLNNQDHQLADFRFCYTDPCHCTHSSIPMVHSQM